MTTKFYFISMVICSYNTTIKLVYFNSWTVWKWFIPSVLNSGYTWLSVNFFIWFWKRHISDGHSFLHHDSHVTWWFLTEICQSALHNSQQEMCIETIACRFLNGWTNDWYYSITHFFKYCMFAHKQLSPIFDCMSLSITILLLQSNQGPLIASLPIVNDPSN